MLIKALAVPVTYTLSAVLVWLAFGSIRYSLPVIALGPSAFDLSDANNIFENETEDSVGIAYTGVSFLPSFFVPLIFLGSLVFAFCAGSGLALLPFNLITWYRNRPRKLEPEEYVIAKKILQRESEQAILIARGAHDIKRELSILAAGDERRRAKLKHEYRNRLAESRHTLREFELMYNAFLEQENILESNPLTYYLYLTIGVVGCAISILFILQTLLSSLGLFPVFEYVLLRIETESYIIAAFAFLGIVVYMGWAIVVGGVSCSEAMEDILPPVNLKPEGTFLESFVQITSYALLSLFGMMVFLVRQFPRYMRYLGFDFYFNRVLTRITFLSPLYRYSIFEYTLLSCFLVTIFVLTFATDGAAMLREKIEIRTLEIAAEKEEVAKLDKAQRASIHS